MSRTQPGWFRRHKWLTAFIVIAVFGWAGTAGADEAEQPPRTDASQQEPAKAPPSPSEEEPTAAESSEHEPSRPGGRGKPVRRTAGGLRRAQWALQAQACPKPAPVPTALVTRVIDGDTLELASGQDVRLVGIDTPEVGECGYDKATANLAYLVEGKQVRLTRSDEDRDHYGRLLRYVNIGDVDAGLRLIKNGLAIARYDSRDGYGYHQREPVYIAADKAKANIKCAPPAPAPAPAPQGSACAPGYSPCVPPYPPDVDCADVNGPITVTGTDPHGLDADGDGVACE